MDGSMARVKQRSGLISKIHWTPLRWPWTKHLRCGPECLFQCPNGALNELKTLNSRKLFSRDCLSLEPHKSHCRFPWCLTSERTGQSWVAWPEALDCSQARHIPGLSRKIPEHEMPPTTPLFKAQLEKNLSAITRENKNNPPQNPAISSPQLIGMHWFVPVFSVEVWQWPLRE